MTDNLALRTLLQAQQQAQCGFLVTGFNQPQQSFHLDEYLALLIYDKKNSDADTHTHTHKHTHTVHTESYLD